MFAELQDRLGAPLVVVLDEFQAVLGAASKIDAAIRSVIQHHDRVGYIFAGSHVGMMRELFSDRARPSMRRLRRWRWGRCRQSRWPTTSAWRSIATAETASVSWAYCWTLRAVTRSAR
jgi:hypothetical protein